MNNLIMNILFDLLCFFGGAVIFYTYHRIRIQDKDREIAIQKAEIESLTEDYNNVVEDYNDLTDILFDINLRKYQNMSYPTQQELDTIGKLRHDLKIARNHNKYLDMELQAYMSNRADKDNIEYLKQCLKAK